jgi:hypothetical protein
MLSDERDELSPTGGGGRSIPWFVGMLLLAAAVALLTWRASSRVNVPGAVYPEIDPVNWVFRDFRDAVYFPVRSLMDGYNPYDWRGHVARYPVGQHFPPYSPLTLAVHWPLGWFSLARSQWLYFAVNIVLTLVLAALILRWSLGAVAAGPVMALAAAILLTRPGQMNLLLGQSSLVLVLATLMCLQHAAARPGLAGLMWALSTLKPTYGGPLLIWLLARGQYRAAACGVAWGALVTLPLLAFVIYLQGGLASFVEVLRDNSQAFDANPGRDPWLSYTRVDALLLWTKLGGWVPPGWFEFAFALAVILSAAALIRFGARDAVAPSAVDGSATLGMLVLLICIYHHAYDMVLLWLPLVAAACSVGPFWGRAPRGVRRVFVVLISAGMLNFVSTHTFLSAVSPTGFARNAITSLNSLILLAAAAWVSGWWVWRGVRGETAGLRSGSDGRAEVNSQSRPDGLE